MKPIKENLSSNISHSFRVKHSKLQYLDSPWHYHEDFEIFYIIKSSGKRFVGDSIDNFSEGDLVFMGPNLPHVWKNGPECYSNKKNNAEAIVVQFKENSLGEGFFNLPEFSAIKKILSLSKRGLRISGITKEKIVPLLSEISKNEGAKRITILLEILDLLSKSKELYPLASISFEKMYFDDSRSRINKILEFVSNNFNKNIQLDEIAEIANMSKTAFCRYFKKRTLKTFWEYLTEVRIGYAGRLLINEDLSIHAICTECGFNSNSYFTKIFKSQFGFTPVEYRIKFKQAILKQNG